MKELLQHPLGLRVVCFPQEDGDGDRDGGPEVPRSWLPLGNWETDRLPVIHALLDSFKGLQPDQKERLELHVTGLSVVYPGSHMAATQRALKLLAPFMSEIRESKRPKATLSQLAPFPKLHTLAFQLPKEKGDTNAIYRALQSSSRLQHLHIHADSQVAAAHAVRFLQTLELPQLTSLRMVTDGYAAVLPSGCLQNLTCIELGTNVSFIGPIPNLRRLRLQRLYRSYSNMLGHLINILQKPVSLALDAFKPESLYSLPDNLQELTVGL